MTKQILMIAGPNGAGKTTLTLELIQEREMFYEMINADEIARGLAPLHPESKALAASKLMVKRFKELLESNRSFAFETTASGTNYIKHLKKAKMNGYEVNLVFLWLESSEQAVKRVAQRVKQGGHHIPDEVIIRRYYAGIKNLLKYYLPLANRACIMDNSSEDSSKRVIARKNQNSPIDILDRDTWEKLEGRAYERRL